jgi:hypothetical protein
MANKRNLQPLLDVMQNQHGLIVSASDSLDTKALGVLGLNAAIVIFTLQSEMHSSWWLLVPLFITLTCSTALTLFIIWPLADHNKYAGAVVDLHTYPNYTELSEEKLILQLVADTQAANDINDTKNVRKLFLCCSSIILSLIGVVLLVGCILRV